MVLVTSIQFDKHIEIGDPVSQAKIYQAQLADELIFIDIDASREGRNTLLLNLIQKTSEEMLMPLTVGGGVTSIDDFRSLLLSGADKVCINTAAINTPDLINCAADMYGAQCVVSGIDVKQENDEYFVYSRCGMVNTHMKPIEWAKEVERRGAGEILLSSIDRDGTRTGLDIELIRSIVDVVKIPVIASGGCGLAKHFVDGFIAGHADAVSAGTYFCFKDENPMQVRSQVKSAGVPIRIYT